MPGLRFHSENYLNIDNVNPTKKFLLTSTPKNFFYNKNFTYLFIPMPFKIISRIFKLKTHSIFKLIDSILYQLISCVFILIINPKIIHVWGGYCFLISIFFKNKKIVIERSSSFDEAQNFIIQNEKVKLGLINNNKELKKKFFFRKLEYERADIIITSSKYSKNTFPINYQNKVKIIYPFSNKIFDYCYKNKSQSSLVLGYVGGNIIVKGLSYIVDAFNMTSSKTELHLKINKSDLNNYPRLKNKIFRNNKIKIIPTSFDMKDFYQSIDMIIQPSIDDGFSMVTISFQLWYPCFSSKNNGSSEFLSEILFSNVFDINDQSF